MDLQEGFHLQQAGDAAVLGVLAVRVEQPRIDFLAFLGAGLGHFAERCPWMGAQVSDQPQFERVDRRQVTTVGQRHIGRRILLVHLGDALFRHLVGRRQVVAQEGRELRQRGIGRNGPVHICKARRSRAQAGQQDLFEFGRILVLVLVPELAQEFLAFTIGKAREVFGAARVVRIGQQGGRGSRQLEHVVAHHVAHQAHEHQIVRGAQAVAHRHDLHVVELVEIAEGVQAAAGKEGFAGIGRILALDGSFQHGRQGALGILGQRQEVFDAPLGQAILGIDHGGAQLAVVHGREALEQLVDDVHVGHQGAQLGGGTQVQLGAFVDVERLVVVVGLNAQVVDVLAALHQRKAVDHLGRVAVAKQALAGQAGGRCSFRIVQFTQHPGDGLLRVGVERAHHRQVEAVQVVQAAIAQQATQVGTHCIGCLARHEGVGGRRAHARRFGWVKLDLEGDVAHQRGDDLGLGQYPQVGIGQLFQVVVAGAQVVRGAALGDHQRQSLLVDHGSFGRGGVVLERAVHGGEIAPVPDPHAVADAVDFAVTRLGRERHGIEVIDHDLAPGQGGVGTVLVGAQGGRGHLHQFFGQRAGAPVGRMAVLLNLRGERAAAGRTLVFEREHAERLVEHGLAEAVPFHRRIALGVGGIEQLAVFDEQQALDQHERRFFELGIETLGVAHGEHGLGAAVENLEADLGLFAVGGKQPHVGQFNHLGRNAGLGGDFVIARLELGEIVGQVGVTEPLVVGAV